jgi:hypothetical protein
MSVLCRGDIKQEETPEVHRNSLIRYLGIDTIQPVRCSQMVLCNMYILLYTHDSYLKLYPLQLSIVERRFPFYVLRRPRDATIHMNHGERRKGAPVLPK